MPEGYYVRKLSIKVKITKSIFTDRAKGGAKQRLAFPPPPPPHFTNMFYVPKIFVLMF